MPALVADWWGLANAVSLGVSVLVRSVILKANRDAIDKSAKTSIQQSSAVVKIFCTITNGCVVMSDAICMGYTREDEYTRTLLWLLGR